MARELQPSKEMKNSKPTQEEISARAYQIFVEKGCQEGRDLENWLQAEAELCGSGKQSQAEISPAMAATGSKPSRHTTRKRA